MTSWLGVYLRGFAMGAADAVPGVSGGTIALVTGIYDRLINAIAGLDPTVAPDVLRSYDATARDRAREALLDMDVPFLAVLGVGVVSGALTLANVVEYGLDTYRALTFAFFFGLIAASPVVLRDEVEATPASLVAGVVGFAVTFSVSGLESQLPGGFVVLFALGAVASSAMVLPGISGSLILLALGKYHVLTGAVGDLTAAAGGLLDGESAAALLDPVVLLGVFSVGAAVGILSFARLVAWALEAHRVATAAFLVGLLVGALRKPAVEVAANVGTWSATATTAVAAVVALGAVAVLAFDYLAGVEG
jgi:putative membrane protein